jgi:glucokinase
MHDRAAPAPLRPAPPDSAPGPVLVADIGGTNTRLALADGVRLRDESVQRRVNADHRALGIGGLVRDYLATQGAPALDGACLAIAGPVRDGAAGLTNLDWRIDLAGLAAAAGTGRVAILNDLQAQGWALDHLGEEALAGVQPGRGAVPSGAARLVVGMGTGFNAAPVHRVGAGLYVPPSECGHAALPVADEDGLAFARWLGARRGFATVEELLSGRGVEAADLFAGLAADPAALPRNAAGAMAALAAGDPRAEAMAQRMVQILGRVCGDLALAHLPEGGIYLCGGVARAFLPWLGRFGFHAALADKGRFSDWLAGLPVQVITDDYAALTGCAARILEGSERPGG